KDKFFFVASYILLVSFNIIIAIIAIKFKGLPSSPLFLY
ncbi:hypothetical protein cco106_09471, partial [Campylobacter coli 2553]